MYQKIINLFTNVTLPFDAQNFFDFFPPHKLSVSQPLGLEFQHSKS